jgi:hypothetical protein
MRQAVYPLETFVKDGLRAQPPSQVRLSEKSAKREEVLV